MQDLIKEASEVYNQLKEIISKHNVKERKFQEIGGLLASLRVCIEEITDLENRLSRDSTNFIYKSQLTSRRTDLARCLLEAKYIETSLEIRLNELLQQDEKQRSFVDELLEFEKTIKARCIEIFWKKRTECIFTDNPEQKAQDLFVAYFAAKLKIHAVIKEFKSGIGFIDVAVDYKNKRYLVEIKMLGGKKPGTHYDKKHVKDGVPQLFKYLETEELSEGFLIILDGRSPQNKEPFNGDKLQQNGITIFVIIIDINPPKPSSLQF